MKNRDLFRLHEGFNRVKDLPGARFALAVARNSRRVALLVEDLENLKKPSEAFEAFQQEEAKIFSEFVARGEDNLPLRAPGKDNSWVISDPLKFQAARKALGDKHSEALTEREKQIEDFKNILNIDVEVQLEKVTEKDLPEGLTGEMAAMIVEMIA